MRHVDEYRDPDAVQAVARQIHEAAKRPWTLMEVCGGQTHSILKFGLDELLPSTLSLVHGPGCPVCVTPLAMIDRAVAIASRPDVTFCSFGDMLRVPGSQTDLLKVKASGGDVRIVYSPLDALRLARENPERKVVFFAVGFETTAPANAMAVNRAAAEGIENFSVLVAHVLVPPALEALLSSEDVKIQGLLAPGPRLRGDRVPRLRAGGRAVRNPHRRHRLRAAGPAEGRAGRRRPARARRGAGREPVPAGGRARRQPAGPADDRGRLRGRRPELARAWGEIPKSGYALAPKYARFDAEQVFDVAGLQVEEPEECLSGLVLQGRLRPTECPEFGTRCTPEHPLGATMVSTEGACAAYFHYGRARREESPADAAEGGTA